MRKLLGVPATGNTRRWRIMDFWERSDYLLLTNWVHIDMIHRALSPGANHVDSTEINRNRRLPEAYSSPILQMILTAKCKSVSLWRA